MGLDNVPNFYPCKQDGTAIEVEDEQFGPMIDCHATITAGGCRWADHFGETDGIVGGFFVSACSFRGKVGQAMLRVLGEDPPFGGFYGPKSEGLDAEQCNGLAAYMEDRAEAFSHKLAVLLREDEALTDEQRTDFHRANVERYRYAARWLRWTAETTGGCGASW